MVCSVPHTGAHLIAKMFNLPWIGLKDIPQRESLYVGHISLGLIDLIMSKDCPIIVPMRHPFLVEESWRRRGKGTPIESFSLLINEVDKKDPYYIAIDSPERDIHLARLNKGLGLKLVNNWEVKNSKHKTYDLDASGLEPSEEMKAFFGANQDFFDRFY